MEIFTSYNLIIEISLIIIISFLFDKIAKKTNIPSVLMLIGLGVGLQYVLNLLNVDSIDFFPFLKILGIVGLIMIVLEAALELELKKEKLASIGKAFLIALVGLLSTSWVIAEILKFSILGMTIQSAWLYATPLAILSSAIVIPSVINLSDVKKEFHVYESTFSDILGIILFYFLIGQFSPSQDITPVGYLGTVLLTVIISIILSYLIILIFQRIERKVKLFLLIAVLLLLYAVGKKFHLSSLIIILIFGLIIANRNVFFPGKLKKYIHQEKTKALFHELHTITAETAFVIRTLFFVVFGLTIVASSLFKLNVIIISSIILLAIIILRFLTLRVLIGKDIFPQTYIAPRGLITILLFYAIPENFQIENFEAGILLFIILVTSVIMTIGIITNKKEDVIKSPKDSEVSDIDNSFD